jgi:hypothetical protein
VSTQHTPGPWKVKAHSTAVLAGRKQICSNVNSASNLPVNMRDDLEIAHANARLIAAAPDLLGALQQIKQRLDTCHLHIMNGHEVFDSFYVEMIDKAIAKATGGAA